jgi:hypothetical protein
MVIPAERKMTSNIGLPVSGVNQNMAYIIPETRNKEI